VVLEDRAVEIAGRDQRDDDHLLRGALEAIDGIDGDRGPPTDLGDLRSERGDDADVVRIDAGGDVGVDDLGDALGLPNVPVPVAGPVRVVEVDAAREPVGEVGGVDAEVAEGLARDFGVAGRSAPS